MLYITIAWNNFSNVCPPITRKIGELLTQVKKKPQTEVAAKESRNP